MKKETVTTLVFLVKDKKVLLGLKKRGFGMNRYNGVGGKVEPGESIEQALVRETQEEIGVNITDFDKKANIIFDEFVKGIPEIVHIHIFIATKWTGVPTESEEMAPKWFSINKLPFDMMWDDDPFWLPKILAGEKVIANFKLDENDKIASENVKIVESF